MKTKRKSTKGRPSIVCIKKSPKIRKNPHRNVKKSLSTVSPKKQKLPNYESPLKHLFHNSSNSPSPTKLAFVDNKIKGTPNLIKENIIKNKDKKETIKKQGKEKIVEKINKRDISEKQVSKTNEKMKVLKDIKMKNNSFISSSPKFTERNKKRKSSVQNISPNPKKKKFNKNKNPLSKINDFNNQSESVILIDDSELDLDNISDHNSDDVVLIDCDEPSTQKDNVTNEIDKNDNLQQMGSVIEINETVTDDADDENLDGCLTPRNSEDCFVVWSSLPKPSTSTEVPSQSTANAVLANLKKPLIDTSDKIFLDTAADFSNLDLLNNENSRPIRKKGRLTKETKKKVTKKSNVNKAIEKAKKVSKTITKTKTKTAKKGELIYQGSEKTANIDGEPKSKKTGLREIVIDGNNVGMAYTKGKLFSETGIELLIKYFTERKHSVKVFIPQYRRSKKFPLLEKWYTDGIVVFTPSRKLGSKKFIPYDDRYILEYAKACDGVVVSQDQFRDLYKENSEYKNTIENRLLVPTFVGDFVMFPQDPLGRKGPSLANFLKH